VGMKHESEGQTRVQIQGDSEDSSNKCFQFPLPFLACVLVAFCGVKFLQISHSIDFRSMYDLTCNFGGLVGAGSHNPGQRFFLPKN